MNNPVVSYLKNHIEAVSGGTCIMYGVNANDILKVVNEDPIIDRWDVTYYMKVTKALKNLNRLVKSIFN